jgi:hypothetical protein
MEGSDLSFSFQVQGSYLGDNKTTLQSKQDREKTLDFKV